MISDLNFGIEKNIHVMLFYIFLLQKTKSKETEIEKLKKKINSNLLARNKFDRPNRALNRFAPLHCSIPLLFLIHSIHSVRDWCPLNSWLKEEKKVENHQLNAARRHVIISFAWLFVSILFWGFTSLSTKADSHSVLTQHIKSNGTGGQKTILIL